MRWGGGGAGPGPAGPGRAAEPSGSPRPTGGSPPSPGPIGGGGGARRQVGATPRTTIEDVLELERLQEEDKKRREGAQQDKSNDPKPNDKSPNPPPPPKPPPKPSPEPPTPVDPIPIAYPNPDDGGDTEAPHRPYHLGLGVGPGLPDRPEPIDRDASFARARHGIYLGGGDDEWGGPNPHVRSAADPNDVAAAYPNPPTAPDGDPNPPGVAGGTSSADDGPLLDARLRYLLAMAGYEAGDEVVINPRALGYKPNPDDPDGPHGPNARGRAIGNPTVRSPRRVGTGRLL